MKKKILAAIVCVVIALSLAGCMNNEVSSEISKSSLEHNTISSTSSLGSPKSETSFPIQGTQVVPPPQSSKSEEPFIPEIKEEDFEFIEEDEKIIITKYIGNETNVVFPKTINGKPVVRIGYNYYSPAVVNEDVKSVVIPDGVTEIAQQAFSYCYNLAEISIPESVTDFQLLSYGENSRTPFWGTAWLENKRAENPLVIVNNTVIDGQTCTSSIEIPEGVKAIAGGAFAGCETVTRFTLPKSLEKIGNEAFLGCSQLTNIVLPDSVSMIGRYAFGGCKTLENVTFPNNTVTLGQYAFYWGVGEPTPWLENMRKKNPLVIINGNLIDGNNYTGDLIIPDYVKSIAYGAFSEASVTSVKFPNGITKIPDGSFHLCNTLQSVIIPESVNEIGDYAFVDCAFESIILPDGLIEIGEGAFSNCAELTSISFPNSVTIIGEDAFYRGVIRNVTLPDNIKSLGKRVFRSDCNITYKGITYTSDNYDELYTIINGE